MCSPVLPGFLMMLKSLLSLVLQPNCLLCDRPSQGELCYDCQQQLKEHKWRKPDQFWNNSLPLFCLGDYEGELKRAITTLKYNHLPQLGEELGRWLGEAWIKSTVVPKKKRFSVIPIPLHPKRLKERGFNQAEVIAQGFCRVTRYPLFPHGLKRVRNTQKLFELSPQERQKTLVNALALGKDAKNKSLTFPVLLIDDIYTTGATVKEAIRVLKQHQMIVGGVAAIARPKH
ncbi:MAG: ComF family protein [Microcystaceae cyanobacterium]